MGHTIATDCKERGFRVEIRKWRSRQDAKNRDKFEHNQQSQRDTGDVYGPIEVNDLRVELGHVLDLPANENPGSAATETGAPWDLEVGVLPENRTTVPRIIATHFGLGVAA